MPKLSGIIVNVFRATGYSSQLNALGRWDELLLVLPGGGPFEPKPSRPPVVIVEREFATTIDTASGTTTTTKRPGKLYLTAYPCDTEGNPLHPARWHYFGGTFIFCSDSRFPAQYPIPLHDRVEQ